MGDVSVFSFLMDISAMSISENIDFFFPLVREKFIGVTKGYDLYIIIQVI